MLFGFVLCLEQISLWYASQDSLLLRDDIVSFLRSEKIPSESSIEAETEESIPDFPVRDEEEEDPVPDLPTRDEEDDPLPDVPPRDENPQLGPLHSEKKPHLDDSTPHEEETHEKKNPKDHEKQQPKYKAKHPKKKKEPTKPPRPLYRVEEGQVAGYFTMEEQDSRSSRFPSVQDRVKAYMGFWYHPPCRDEDFVPYRRQDHLVLVREFNRAKFPQYTFAISGMEAEEARVLLANETMDCSMKIGQDYCPDMQEYFYPSLKRIEMEDHPFLVQFGDVTKINAHVAIDLKDDGRTDPQIPVLKKFRRTYNMTLIELKKNLALQTCRAFEKVMLHEIVIMLTSQRHLGFLPTVPPIDIPWSEKRDMAVFRGGLTGYNREHNVVKLKREGKITNDQQCEMMHKCRLVLRAAESELVDAKLTSDPKHVLPHIKKVKGVEIYGESMTLEQMLKCKAIIMLEGNDVASGLKWALYSKSVVMAQAFTKASWVMEDMLIPWVHYIPLSQDLSDVHEKMQWVIDHDDEAQEIARNGQLWIIDLLYHPDSDKDTKSVYDEMLTRYTTHFVLDDTLTVPESQAKNMNPPGWKVAASKQQTSSLQNT